MIDAFAPLPQYARHLRPIWDALPERLRGHWYTGEAGDEPIHGTTPTVVASGSSLDLVATDRPTALVEHGAGQTYFGLDASGYAGGRWRERVSLFLCPSQRVADLNGARYPDARVEVVCCPALDWWPRWSRSGLACKDWSGRQPTVALAWHWDGPPMVPEAVGAFDYYAPRLAQLAERYRLLGSGHPRAREMLAPEYDRLGIDTCWDPDEVIRRADLLVADNTSLMYEAAACGVPVLALDGPGYRDQPRHGLRFYDQVPGLRLRAHRAQGADCGPLYPHHGREQLLDAVTAALDDPPEVASHRARVSEAVYGPLDGKASARAVAALLDWID